MPVGPYFADFLCREHKLVVEIDGYSHEGRQAYDRQRERAMENAGYSILRFTNDDVVERVEGVVYKIATALAALVDALPTPSRRRERFE